MRKLWKNWNQFFYLNSLSSLEIKKNYGCWYKFEKTAVNVQVFTANVLTIHCIFAKQLYSRKNVKWYTLTDGQTILLMILLSMHLDCIHIVSFSIACDKYHDPSWPRTTSLPFSSSSLFHTRIRWCCFPICERLSAGQRSSKVTTYCIVTKIDRGKHPTLNHEFFTLSLTPNHHLSCYQQEQRSHMHTKALSCMTMHIPMLMQRITGQSEWVRELPLPLLCLQPHSDQSPCLKRERSPLPPSSSLISCIESLLLSPTGPQSPTAFQRSRAWEIPSDSHW